MQKIIKTLYNGEVEIEFNPNNHRYKKSTGEYLTSVTSITGILDKSPQLMHWAVNLAKDHLMEIREYGGKVTTQDVIQACGLYREHKKQAADTGTLVHEYAEQYIAGKDPKLPDDEKAINGITAFIKWMEDSKAIFSESERLVYSKKYDYVGMLDGIAKIDGKIYLVDFKTSKGVYPEMKAQVAAYREAYAEEMGLKFDASLIIQFNKETGEPVPHIIDTHKDDFQTFLSMLQIKKWLNNNK